MSQLIEKLRIVTRGNLSGITYRLVHIAEAIAVAVSIGDKGNRGRGDVNLLGPSLLVLESLPSLLLSRLRSFDEHGDASRTRVGRLAHDGANRSDIRCEAEAFAGRNRTAFE